MFVPNSIEEKKAIVDECLASGLTKVEYCRKNNICPSTFEGWLNRFYPDRKKKSRANHTGIVKVQSACQRKEIVMEYRGARIRFEPSQLKAVMEALCSVSG